MLHLQKWFLSLQNPHWEVKWPHWDIFDPDTQLQVGVVRVSQMSLKRLFLFGWLNPLLELRAVPDGSLVCSVRWRVSFWRPGAGLQVRNPSNELVGDFRRKWFSLNGGYRVYDGRHQL